MEKTSNTLKALLARVPGRRPALRAILVAVGLAFLYPANAEQFVEVTVEVETIAHPAETADQSIEHSYQATARCLVGTNLWQIEGDFLRNANASYWFTGSNIIKHTVVTKQLPDPKVGNLMFLGKSPPIGDRTTVIYDHRKGEPIGDSVATIVWLAYCSGTYLKQENRTLPFLTGFNAKTPKYSDETSVFRDAFGLPNNVKLYSQDKLFACQDQVLQSTNFMGWTFPRRLRATAQRYPGRGWEEVLGTLTSIGPGRPPEIPDVVRTNLSTAIRSVH